MVSAGPHVKPLQILKGVLVLWKRGIHETEGPRIEARPFRSFVSNRSVTLGVVLPSEHGDHLVLNAACDMTLQH